MLFKEAARLSAAEAEENNVNLLKARFRREMHVDFTDKPLMDGSNVTPCKALVLHPFQVDVRVIEQQAYQLAGRISVASDNSCFNHLISLVVETLKRFLVLAGYRITLLAGMKRCSTFSAALWSMPSRSTANTVSAPAMVPMISGVRLVSMS